MRNWLFVLFLLIFSMNPAFAIKIGLLTDVSSAGVGTSADGVIIDARTNRTVTELKQMKGYLIVPRGSQMSIKINGEYKDINSDRIVIKSYSNGFVSTKKKWYRGNLIVQNRNGRLTVINDIDLENYLKGVIPSEMPSSWDVEAHKAQAIAARSYALANLGKRASKGYDLEDTPNDQAYGGASAEKRGTTKAVNDTRGIVLTHNQKIISAFYTASAGGKTKTSNWGGNVPYLRSVPSYDAAVGKKGHGVGMSQYGANHLAKQGYNAYQILKYFYKDVNFARLKTDI
ncbi:MAG: SpoIID/LytB domain-containing protein [Fusobacterium sp.]|nr:SpoIID/LytB domain-containing protein [Fusobacterium sp.]